MFHVERLQNNQHLQNYPHSSNREMIPPGTQSHMGERGWGGVNNNPPPSAQRGTHPRLDSACKARIMYHWYIISGVSILAKSLREAYRYYRDNCKEKGE